MGGGCLAEHPTLARWLAGAARVAVSTDDPALFGVTLSGEFDRIEMELGASREALALIARAAFAAAFAPQDEVEGALTLADRAGRASFISS